MDFAGSVYIFRHAVLRDAAYQLMPPGDRAALHAQALLQLEHACGGRAPATPEIDPASDQRIGPHATDVIAHELAWHAAHAGSEPSLLALYLRRAAELAVRQYRAADSAELWLQLSHLGSQTARTEATRRAGVEYLAAHNIQRGHELLEQALQRFRELGNRFGEGVTLGNLAVHHYQSGRGRIAEDMNTQALAILSEGGSRRALATTLGNQATIFLETGRLEQAEEMIGRALAVFAEIDEQRLHATALGNLGILYHWTDRLELAEQTFEKALAEHRQAGNTAGAGNVLSNLGILYRDTGRADKCESMYRRALADLRQAGDLRNEGITLGNMASLLASQGRYPEAEAAGRQSLALHAMTGNLPYEALAWMNLSRVYSHTRRFAQALDALERSVAAYAQVGDRANEAVRRCETAVLLLKLGRMEEARQQWQQGWPAAGPDHPEMDKPLSEMREACAAAGVPAFA